MGHSVDAKTVLAVTRDRKVGRRMIIGRRVLSNSGLWCEVMRPPSESGLARLSQPLVGFIFPPILNSHCYCFSRLGERCQTGWPKYNILKTYIQFHTLSMGALNLEQSIAERLERARTASLGSAHERSRGITRHAPFYFSFNRLRI